TRSRYRFSKASRCWCQNMTAMTAENASTGRTAPRTRISRCERSFMPSVRAEVGNREYQVQRAAELVEPLRIPPNEGVALLVGQLGATQRRRGILMKARAKRAVLLEPIQHDVDVVAAHGRAPPPGETSHSSAARSMRPISPKKRTRARAGATAPSSTIQFSS